MLTRLTAALFVALVLGCTSGPAPAEPACKNPTLRAAVDGQVDMDIKAIGHRACVGGFALVAVAYECEACEPFEQFFLQADGSAWKVLSSGTGLDPASCQDHQQVIDPQTCADLWKSFQRDEKRRAQGKGKKKR